MAVTVARSGMGFFQSVKNDVALYLPGRNTSRTARVNYDPETELWIQRASSSGGQFMNDSKQIADALIKAIKRKAYNSKIVYLLPLLGSNLITALVPLRDKLGVGAAANTNFVDADFSQITGLQGDGATKILDSLITPDRLGISMAGGIGWFENNIGSANRGPTGYAHNPGGGTRAYGLYIGTSSYGLDWGKNGEVDVSGRPGNGHYYGQNPVFNQRDMNFNGSFVGTDTTSATLDDAAYTGIRLMGQETSNVVAGPYYWAGRCACAYMTDGTLFQSEISDFHNLLMTNLINRTYRPAA